MTKLKKTLGSVLLIGSITAGSFFGAGLVRDAQFARAEEKVQATREQLASANDLAAVFKEVSKAVEPSVVKIDVRKTLKGVSSNMPSREEDLLRRFFGDRGGSGGGGNDSGGDEDAMPNDPNHRGGGSDGDGGMEQIGTGSGVIMETDGSTAYILTNNHVAGGADEMLVTLGDGRQIKGGKTVGADPKTDLALVKLNVDHVIPAKWGDSQQLEKGDWVLAFGSPFGYVGSMTHGVVSALNRDVGILRNQQGYESFIQVDAPINPGNSGGPLVNLKGEVIGVNTAIASRSGGFQGIGFAIPSNQAKFVYQQLKSSGKVTRGWLGVSIASVSDSRTQDVARSFGYNELTGVLVQQVLEGTPAAGKLEDGDIVTKLNGKDLRDASQLRNMVAGMAPGTEVTMTVFRSGKTQDVKLKLGEQPDNPSLARGGRGGNATPDAPKAQGLDKLGMKLSDINDQIAERFNLGEQKQGAVVTQVDPRSVAARNDLRPGDVITKVEGKAVKNATEARDALKDADLAKGVRVYVNSPIGSRYVVLKNEGDAK
ncbi:MAG TPA: trypsin-like peptidase domain-containing protein [Tepidisphaeraceae bacterium]